MNTTDCSGRLGCVDCHERGGGEKVGCYNPPGATETPPPISSTEAPCYAKYSVSPEDMILKDGHCMFPADIARDLNRKSYLEERYAKLKERERANIKPS